MSAPELLRIDTLSKQFGKVTALHAVSLRLESGRIYGLAGENGAGKSTLIKILGGVHPADSGQMLLDGAAYRPRNPGAAEAVGMSVFHQEIPVCPNLSVAANIFLGPKLPHRGLFPDWKGMEQRAQQLFTDYLGIDINPRRLMRDCTIAERQLTLLARVLSRQARLIILDEPTTALSPAEVTRLLAVLRRLCAQGVTLLFVSHLLDELIELCDEIYIFRDGRNAGHLQRTQFDPGVLASLIAGRELLDRPPRPSQPESSAKLEVRGLSRAGEFEEVSFRLAPGEVLGIAGLQGSGRSAVARALFAAPPAERGAVLLNGAPVVLRTPRDAIRAGIGYVPEDRKTLGLFAELDIQSNLGLLRLDALRQFGLVSRAGLRRLALELKDKLRIRLSATDAPITSLSGGNQQKVLIGRWLAMQPQILVMNEPTRGVDVGAKTEIAALIQALAEGGCSLVVASSDFDELLRLADRCLVMNRGRLVADIPRALATKQSLIRAAGTQSAVLPLNS